MMMPRLLLVVTVAAVGACAHAPPRKAAPPAPITGSLPPIAVLPTDSVGVVVGTLLAELGPALDLGRVQMSGVSRAAGTDSAGRFRLAAPPGLHTITVSRLGFARRTDTIVVPADRGLDLAIAMRPSDVQLEEVYAGPYVPPQLALRLRVHRSSAFRFAIVEVRERGVRIARDSLPAARFVHDTLTIDLVYRSGSRRVNVDVTAPGYHRWSASSIDLPTFLAANLERIQ